jgi:hypothetical protein
MKTSEFLISHTQEIFAKCVEVMKKKNADYSASEKNAFRNFEGVEYFHITDTKTGMMVRLTDKFIRISHLLKNEAKVKDESLKDSIEDAINYLAIMHAYLEHEGQNDHAGGAGGSVHDGGGSTNFDMLESDEHSSSKTDITKD